MAINNLASSEMYENSLINENCGETEILKKLIKILTGLRFLAEFHNI